MTNQLATEQFAISAWIVGRDNHQRVAAAQIGAPTVLDVDIHQGADLSDLVARADPGGRQASAVQVAANNGYTTVAVDPSTFLPSEITVTDPDGNVVPIGSVVDIRRSTCETMFLRT